MLNTYMPHIFYQHFSDFNSTNMRIYSSFVQVSLSIVLMPGDLKRLLSLALPLLLLSCVCPSIKNKSVSSQWDLVLGFKDVL